MAADVDICNLALQRVGQNQGITSLDPAVDGSVNGKKVQLAYPKALRALLARASWGFATCVAVLEVADHADEARVVPGWDFTYSLPADCLKPRYVSDGVRPGIGDEPRTPFDYGAGLLFTDLEDAQLVYTGDETTVEADGFPPLFADALMWRLASVAVPQPGERASARAAATVPAQVRKSLAE